jgi:hypothetical protein
MEVRMSQDVEISKEGIKLSYLRFMSDSAPGYLVLLLLGLAYLRGRSLPFLESAVSASQLGTEAKIFFFVLLFLLATPMGLMLNGISWYLIGNLQILLLGFWLKFPRVGFLLRGTRKAMQFDDLQKFFNFPLTFRNTEGKNTLYEHANYYQGVLAIYFPNCHAQLEDTVGLRLLVRSLALIAFLVSIYCYINVGILAGSLILAAFILLVLLSSFDEYYQCLEVLYMVYVLSSETPPTPDTREKIVKGLIAASDRLRKNVPSGC